jgi:hypothetical protein
VSPFPPSFNSNSQCIRTRSCHSLPTIDHPLSPLFSFHALTNPSSTLIDLQALYFHALTNPFPRNPFSFTSIQNPGGVGGCISFPTPRSAPAPAGSGRLPARQAGLSVEKLPNSFPDIPLRTLEISFPSFSTSRPLFSIVCGLFLQNRGVWGGRTRKTKLVWGKKVTSGSSAASATSALAPSRKGSID